MTLLVDIRINNNPEWITYKNNPSPNTLSEFINTCRKQGTEEIILYSLYIAYVNTGNWKIAQHLSLLLEEQKQSTYADYFVYKALQESKGDVSARLLSAKLLWLRRLPLEVIYETTIIRHQIKKIKDKNRRFIILGEVAKLNIMAFSYLREMKSAIKWFQYLNRIQGAPPASPEVMLQLFLGAIHSQDHYMAGVAAKLLVPNINNFGDRIKSMIRSEISIMLIGTLKEILVGKSQK